MAILQKPAALLPLCWGNLYRHKWSLQFILWDMKESLTLLSCNSWQIIFPDETRQCLSNEPTGRGKREMRGALRYPQIEKMASKSAMCPTALSMARPPFLGAAWLSRLPWGRSWDSCLPRSAPSSRQPLKVKY